MATTIIELTVTDINERCEMVDGSPRPNFTMIRYHSAQQSTGEGYFIFNGLKKDEHGRDCISQVMVRFDKTGKLLGELVPNSTKYIEDLL